MVKSLLPPNATPLERTVSSVLGAPFDVLSVPLRDIWDPWSCPIDLLPWLAWTVAVDEWDEGWPEATRRQAVADQIALHRRRGTVWAVERAIERSSLKARIIEQAEQRAIYSAVGARQLDGTWSLDGSVKIDPVESVAGIPQIQHWAQFIVQLDLSEAQRVQAFDQARRLVEAWKPARSWPIWAFILRVLIIVSIQMRSSLLLEKSVTGRYPWCGRVVGDRPDAVWSLGRDASPVKLPQQFGSFRVGQMAGGLSVWRLRSCRITSGLLASLIGPAVATAGLPRVGQSNRRLDNSWRLGARVIDVGSSAQLLSKSTVPVPVSASVGFHEHSRLSYPVNPARLAGPVTRLTPWNRVDGRWAVGSQIRRLPFGFKMGRDGSVLIETSGFVGASSDPSTVGPSVALGQPGRVLDGSWGLSGRDATAFSDAVLVARSTIDMTATLAVSHRFHGHAVYPGDRPKLSGGVRRLAAWSRVDGSWRVGAAQRTRFFGFKMGREAETPILASSAINATALSSCVVSTERLGLLRSTKLSRRARLLDGSWRLGNRSMVVAPRIGGFALCYDMPGSVYEPVKPGARRIRLDSSWAVGGRAKPHSSIRIFKGAVNG